ncbi:hypothetical protein HMPREF0490_00833 [Lachnospiraceae bacterium 6_1_37FAA]|nr:hypothetical protein HMPREF0490_00833 [Lachnospiraceae bacterium 6_1_37FAA]
MNNRRVLLKSYVWGHIVSNRLASLLNSIKGKFKELTLSGTSVQGENPAPDNPQEIKSAGRKSRNLFDITKYDKYDDTWTNTTYTTKKLKLKPNTTYTISCKRLVDKPKQYVFFNITEGIATGRGIYIQIKPDLALNYFISKGTFTTNDVGEITLSYYVDCPKEQYWFTEVIGDIQIEEGNKATSYEPYTDKYLIDVKVTGKNLLNLQKEPDVKGTYQGWKVGDGKKTIVLSIEDKGNNADITKCSIGVSGNGINPNDGLGWIVQDGTILRSEIKTTNPYVTIYPPNETAVQKFLDRFEIQVEYGTTATPYEPYAEQSLQIALNEPLRGVGEYKDMLTKDGVVRKIKQITVNEKSNLIFYTESKNTLGYLVKVPDATQTNYTYSVISDRFVKTQYIDSNDTNGVVTLFAQQIIFRVSKEIANNIYTLKEWLVDNNITFNYVLESPITEPLPESVQAQLSALHSENGVTHVFVDSGEVEAGISVTYKQKK